MDDMCVPRKLRVWAERVTTEPPFAERGIPDASTFYALLDARLPALPPRHRAVLARAKHAAIEHIDTAREALERMRAIESEQLPVSAESFPAEVSEHTPVIEEDGISWVSVRRSEGIIWLHRRLGKRYGRVSAQSERSAEDQSPDDRDH